MKFGIDVHSTEQERQDGLDRLDTETQKIIAEMKANRKPGPIRQFKWQHANSNYFGGL